ncbi:TonB-dependent receptor [Meridianimaribacter sp. CL38]|uniref:TonB-dependent receptor plug domain-containing protein n=1 Tax=Meridianimaribacter sp. CL38 TaxID=2213021 RepID=UPI001038A911|nr:TonB-dependent receptor plug domain-containing protein [Meridianimaribacter sp. CL38]TBV25616.1 TonB-dependent receptor [Meridianimaribacter sp. CL38]
MNKKTLFFGVFCATSIFGFAQQQTDSTQVEQLNEVVITDSKFNLKRENSGKVITKITQEELQHLQGKTIAEIINATAGIEINGTKSNAGQNLAYYVRGGRNRQVLVLIDGIALTDPSQIANDYDLRLLNPDQVESIEILKGASSTLYGTGAATAVINIKLKKASKDAVSANFRSVFGTNQSHDDNNYAIEDFRNSVSVNGTIGEFNYLASFGNQFTDGLSAMEAGTESDAYNAINGNVKLGYTFSKQFKLNAYASFDKFKADFDDASTFSDANNHSTSKQYRVGIAPEFSYKKGSITLNAAYNDVERIVESSYPAEYYATSLVADLFNRYNFNDKFYTILGVNFQENDMESFVIPFGSTNLEQSIDPETATFNIVDPYANVVYVSDFGLNVNAGARLNNHSEYGSHLVYSLNPSYRKSFNFGYLKGMASYSTAYITPSLYQLFEPAYGNADLKPEENETIEVGIEAGIKDKATFSLVYFTRNETNFIDFVDMGNFVYQYDNVDEDFTASGLEFTANYSITNTLTLNANVTYTKVEDDLNLRIPELKGNARLDYKLSDATFLSLAYQYNDDRNDAYFNNTTFTTEDVTLKSYSLLDFYVSHTILENKLKLFANVNNIFNEDYQELFGYSTRGRNVNIGFNLSL